ncbi:transporter substrate-binding domain-containing protein [Cnuibacter physcomitrellae]|uniref:transporter substrate-binding domain-containing protein n=1 Tax=Cnuibacter physcomitrellae TaxID=1619308 RepID=UPI0021760C07|nr:transporter substrate-binding domain-containing protein [Cnuibacter physcomitrellae]MCS5498288.1 transporter substrate-binding domain-containing protein [Cnuibacter physcomitrellae]
MTRGISGGSRRTRRTLGVALIGGALAASLVACSAGADASSSSSPDTEVVQAAYDALPQDIKDAGVIKTASAFDYGPWAYIDASTGDMAGFDYDVVNEIVARLGIQAQWANLGTFESVIPAAQSGQADAVVDGMGIIDDRLPAVSFVYDMVSDVAVLVKAGNPADIDPADLCGDHLTTAPSGLQNLVFTAVSEQCVADGKDPINVDLIGDTAAGTAAVLSGQVDGQGYGTAVGKFTTAANPDFEVTAPVPGYATPNGIVLQGSDRGEQIGTAFALALQSMMDDGTLQEIADKNDMGSTAPTQTMYVRTPDQLAELMAANPDLSDGL